MNLSVASASFSVSRSVPPLLPEEITMQETDGRIPVVGRAHDVLASKAAYVLYRRILCGRHALKTERDSRGRNAGQKEFADA